MSCVSITMHRHPPCVHQRPTLTLQITAGRLLFWEQTLSTQTLAQTTFALTDQVIAITGASSGFGYHFAGVLAAQGAKVVLGARRLEKLEDCVKEIKADLSLIHI